MKILELFAGSRSIGKVGEKLGHDVFSTDLIDFGGMTLTGDILKLDYKNLGFTPCMIWASPPCTTFSVASIGTHWTGGVGKYKPKTKACKLGFKILEKTIEIIAYFQEQNPDLIFHIENPRGVMRKIIDNLFEKHGVIRKRVTVWYCQYGDERGKPTDIWTNNRSWIPKKECRNYKYDKEGNIIDKHCHHEGARRGARTGTQGRGNAHERSKIPEELCLDIIKSIT